MGEAVSKSQSWLRKMGGYGAYILFLGVVSFFLAEGGIRIGRPQPEHMRWLIPDTTYGHVMRKNYRIRFPFIGTDVVMDVQTNSLGLRDEEVLPEKEGQDTILFLGDSFTFGHGVPVEERFDTKLESLLADSDPPYRLINAGVSSYGTLSELAYGRDHLDVFTPEVVVLQYCGNDPEDDETFLTQPQTFDNKNFPGKAFLRNHSHLVRFALRQLYLRGYRKKFDRKIADEKAQGYDPAVQEQSAWVISKKDWERTKTAIHDFHATLIAFNPKAHLFVISSDPFDSELNGLLGEFDNGGSLRFLDMAADVADLTRADIALPFDGHWNPGMHTMVADKILSALAAK